MSDNDPNETPTLGEIAICLQESRDMASNLQLACRGLQAQIELHTSPREGILQMVGILGHLRCRLEADAEHILDHATAAELQAQLDQVQLKCQILVPEYPSRESMLCSTDCGKDAYGKLGVGNMLRPVCPEHGGPAAPTEEPECIYCRTERNVGADVCQEFIPHSTVKSCCVRCDYRKRCHTAAPVETNHRGMVGKCEFGIAGGERGEPLAQCGAICYGTGTPLFLCPEHGGPAAPDEEPKCRFCNGGEHAPYGSPCTEFVSGEVSPRVCNACLHPKKCHKAEPTAAPAAKPARRVCRCGSSQAMRTAACDDFVHPGDGHLCGACGHWKCCHDAPPDINAELLDALGSLMDAQRYIVVKRDEGAWKHAMRLARAAVATAKTNKAKQETSPKGDE